MSDRRFGWAATLSVVIFAVWFLFTRVHRTQTAEAVYG